MTPSHVDSSTDSTASKSKNRPSPKPFQNLEGLNSVQSPEQGASSTDVGVLSTTESALPIQQLQQKTPTLPSKSPWKSSPMGVANSTTNAPRFSLGNIKPASSRAQSNTSYALSTTSRIASVNRPKRRNRYKTSGVFQVRRNKRGSRAPIDKAQMNKLLLNARPAIEASTRKAESDESFRTTFQKCKPGVQLHPSNRGRLNGRLPSQESSIDTTKFLTNGKRPLERDESKKTFDDSSLKKRRVNFGDDINNEPIENLVSTPSKDTGSSKRKATPYKPADDESKTPVSQRRILRARRSPPTKKPDTAHEGFPIMPHVEDTVGGDFSSWYEPNEGESLTSTQSNMVMPKNFMNFDLPRDGPIDMVDRLKHQFTQKPLFLGERQDRSVPDYESDDDDDGSPTKQVAKVTKLSQGESAEVTMTEGWGNRFAHLYDGRTRCDACGVWNENDRTKCVSCGEILPTSGDRTNTNGNTSTAVEPAALGASIGPSGFSFGASAAASPSAAPTNGNTSTAVKPAALGASIGPGGFSFGASAAASTSAAPSAGGFKFGAASLMTVATATEESPSATTTSGVAAKSKSKSPSSSTAEPSASTGGFQFGAVKSESPAMSAPSSGAGGFKFGSDSTKSKTPAPAAQSQSPAPAPAPKPFSFGSPSEAEETTAPATLTSANSGAHLFGNFAASGSRSAQASTPAFNLGTISASKRDVENLSTTEPAKKKKCSDDSDSKQCVPTFSSSKATAAAPASTSATSSFSFGSTPALAAPTPAAPSFGSTPAPAAAPTPAAPSFGSTPASAAAPTPAAHIAFGSTPAATPAPPPAAPPFTFGSTPAPAAAPTPAVPSFSFGSTPAPAPAPTGGAPFSFGSTTAAPSFGSTAPVPAPMTFGPTPSMTGPSSGFGSTPAPSNGMNFGSTTPAQGSATFGSTPVAAPGFGAPAAMTFGASTPAPAPVPFGSTPIAPQPFGSAPVPTFNGGATTFGTSQPVAPPMAPGGFGTGGFGATPQQPPSAPPNAGFSLGTGGGGPSSRTPGRGRRRIRAKRPGR